MTNVTFLIGNGFDLACGLKSRYMDTYEGYVESPSEYETIAHFKTAIKKDLPPWAAFEMQLATYAKELDNEEELMTCIRDYNAYLSDYLTKEQQSFWDKYASYEKRKDTILDEIGRSLAMFYKGLTVNDDRIIESIYNKDLNIHYSFINFNYTDIFDRFIKDAINSGYVYRYNHATYSYSEVMHIHGSLGGPVTLGVDNEEQLSDLHYVITRRGKRTLIKPVFLQSYDDSRLTSSAEIITSSDIVCVFGLSLGDSDLTWRKSIASWLQSSDKHHLVYYKHEYMKNNYHPTAVTKRMEDEEDYKDLLLSFLYNESFQDDVRESILSRIHIPVGVRIFNMKEAMHKAFAAVQKANERKSKILSESE